MTTRRLVTAERSWAVEDTVRATPMTSLVRMIGTTTTIGRSDQGQMIGGSALWWPANPQAVAPFTALPVSALAGPPRAPTARVLSDRTAGLRPHTLVSPRAC